MCVDEGANKVQRDKNKLFIVDPTSTEVQLQCTAGKSRRAAVVEAVVSTYENKRRKRKQKGAETRKKSSATMTTMAETFIRKPSVC